MYDGVDATLSDGGGGGGGFCKTLITLAHFQESKMFPELFAVRFLQVKIM